MDAIWASTTGETVLHSIQSYDQDTIDHTGQEYAHWSKKGKQKCLLKPQAAIWA